MSQPPQPPQYPGAGTPGPSDPSGAPQSPYSSASQSSFGSAPQSPYGSGSTPAAPAPKKRWPLFAALGGCGCLLLIGILVAVIGLGGLLGGSDSDPTPSAEPVTTSEAPSSEAPSDPATSDASSSAPASSDPAASGTVTAADQQSAKESTVGYLHALLDQDPEKACTFVLDPASNAGPLDSSSAFWSTCVDAMKESITDVPADAGSIRSAITPDIFDATERPDGKLDVSSPDFDATTVFILTKAGNGSWYIDSIAMASEG
ncbi:hypothetical protein Bequi_13305 [Brachybacterium sp. JHP9]|uniref:Uncharacterized protein n=1 Tax=Brachybacterium equifaecis TaxID=2910770 RepID=A0ABT0R331_9MICO|nr:hypothetical protein [Brachybacterium equifaecis]MCL6424342.1 hypothetical protein [Brachybacterium equifaecis]